MNDPTLYQYPERGSCYYWKNKKFVLPEPFLLFADFEMKVIPIISICSFCDAKVILETDEEKIDDIVKSCNHRKEPHRSCPECSLQIKSRLLNVAKTCASKCHIRTSQSGICDSCYKAFETKSEACVHKHGTNIRCDSCVTTSDFCKHYSTEKVKN